MSLARTPSKPTPHHFPSPSKASPVRCISIVAEADPSALPRIFDMIAMFDLIPERCHVSRSERAPGRPLLIDLQIADLRAEDAHRIEKKLERMVLVTQILCSEKRQAAA